MTETDQMISNLLAGCEYLLEAVKLLTADFDIISKRLEIAEAAIENFNAKPQE